MAPLTSVLGWLFLADHLYLDNIQRLSHTLYDSIEGEYLANI